MSLLQQIQREINEEARIERFIEKKKLKILKLPQNRCYKLVDSKDKAAAFLIFTSKDFSRHSILANEDKEAVTKLEASPNVYLFPLRNTNRKDSKRTTTGTIRSTLIPASYVTINNS